MLAFKEKKEYNFCTGIDLWGGFSEYILTVNGRKDDLLTGYLAVKIYTQSATLTQQLGFIEAIVKRNNNIEYIELATENVEFKIFAYQERKK